MKKSLIITEEEKRRILQMHTYASNKMYLKEGTAAKSFEMAVKSFTQGTSVVESFHIPYGQGAKFFKDGSILIWNGKTGLIYGPTYSTKFVDGQFSTEQGDADAKNAKTILSVISVGDGKGLYVGEQLFTGDVVLKYAAEMFNANFINNNLKSFITQTGLPAPTTITTKSALQAAMKGTGSLANIPNIGEKMTSLVYAFSLS